MSNIILGLETLSALLLFLGALGLVIEWREDRQQRGQNSQQQAPKRIAVIYGDELDEAWKS